MPVSACDCERPSGTDRMEMSIKVFQLFLNGTGLVNQSILSYLIQQRKRDHEPHLRVFDLSIMNLAEGTPVAF